jgi:hypothetical protein
VTSPVAVVIGCRWFDRDSELAFVTRSIAGAGIRTGPVAVLVPGTPEPAGDGAFDLRSMGSGAEFQWPHDLDPDTTVIVDSMTPALAARLAVVSPRAVLFVDGDPGVSRPGWQRLELVEGDHPVYVHVPVNRLAERHRHHGFGFTEYLLVLADPADQSEEPPPAAAWLTAGFNDDEIVVVKDAVASAWKGRALRGRVTVDTRMDLWRLMAHAAVCIDLAPGAHIARECLEALRFGVPVIVPDRSGPGEFHARASGGATFVHQSELLSTADRFRDPSHRALAAQSARQYAETRYGDPTAAVRRLQELLCAGATP